TAVSELEASTKENDVEAIKAKTEALQNIIMPITQRAYEAAQGQGGAQVCLMLKSKQDQRC
ncbi:hypothetical protein D9B85_13185, partial [Corynebacterium diphtheriae]